MLVWVGLLAQVSLPSTWCMFRGNPQRTGRISGTGTMNTAAAWTTDTVPIGNGWGGMLASPLIYDYSGDGRADVVAPLDDYTNNEVSTCYLYRMNPPGPATRVWQSPDSFAINAPGALMDVTGDGRPEIFVVSRSKDSAVCYNGATGAIFWKTALPPAADYFYQEHCLLAIPYPSDSGRIVVEDRNGVIYGLNARSGALRWTQQYTNVSRGYYGGPAAGDVTGDGVIDVVCPVYGRFSGFLILNPVNGNIIAKDSIGYYCDTYTPSLDNFDADLALEIVALYRRESPSPYYPRVSLRNYTGSGFSAVWTFNVEASVPGLIDNPGSYYPSPAVGNLGGTDTKPDVVFRWNRDTFLIAVDGANGNLLWYRVKRRLGDWFYGHPTLADVDGDGYLEVVMPGGNCQGQGMMYFFEHDGKLKGIWDAVRASTSSRTYFKNEAAFGDTDNDGRIEVIGITDDPHLFVLDGSFSWNREPVCGEPVYEDIEESNPLPKTEIWASRGKVFLRIRKPESVDLRLYDCTGRLVEVLFSGRAKEGTMCFEGNWGSGVMIAVLRGGSGMKAVRFVNK